METQLNDADGRQHWLGSAGGVLHLSLWLVMGGLLLQGIGSLMLRAQPSLAASSPAAVSHFFSDNPPHAWVHIAWGAVGLVMLITRRPARVRWWLALIFGVFYTLLGLLGVAVHNPFGLALGLVENTFHLLVGPFMLLLVVFARRDVGGPTVVHAAPRVS